MKTKDIKNEVVKQLIKTTLQNKFAAIIIAKNNTPRFFMLDNYLIVTDLQTK